MRKIWKKSFAIVATSILAVSVLAGCGGNKSNVDKDGVTTVKVGVVGEYNEQWDTINQLLEKDKIKVELVKFSDYAIPNRALNDGEIDLNAFQHKAFLENDIKQKGYQLESIGDTVIAPLSIYNNKDKVSSVEEIKDGDIIAIPSDLTNGGRALKLLEAAGLIECDPEKGYVPTKADITKYNVKIEIKEAESATLAKLLPDCTAAVINGGNAFTAGLDPTKDSIFTEDVNPENNGAVESLVNVIVARSEDKDNEIYKKIVDAYHTDEVKKTVEEMYHGAFLCVW
ncbi:MAG TPA: MetQ/NlpA family ABC transporter substrate-binding protein [Candidatus Scybalomonas excrementigallinarum]|nr:MetQ/NlpA family ABC transporter substrate-binding protein [Candidatus Scybalomonas excrementigallinarum]